MPYFFDAGASRSWRRKFKALTDAHAGRSSLLVRDDDVEVGKQLLRALYTRLKDWDTFQLTLLEGSAGHQALADLQRAGQLLARCIASVQSPYVELAGNWTDTFDALPKKLRWTIRKAEKELSAKGTLTYEFCQRAEQNARLFADIYAIERQSWKEQSGTSITAHREQQLFYEALAMHAAQAGSFSAHVLRLDDQPLAYILGLSAGDGVFLDLKESFADAYAQYSPAHVLKKFAMTTLIEQGVRVYDFMGVCEPYKMRWTDKTYRRHTFVLYNKTWRGRLLYWAARSKPNPSTADASSTANPAISPAD
jgi:CelD/BcsL family acetyltransferase involved in cellulose biosynthesis